MGFSAFKMQVVLGEGWICSDLGKSLFALIHRFDGLLSSS